MHSQVSAIFPPRIISIFNPYLFFLKKNKELNNLVFFYLIKNGLLSRKTYFNLVKKKKIQNKKGASLL